MNIDKFKDAVNSSMSNNSKSDLINRTNDNLYGCLKSLTTILEMLLQQ